MKTIRQVAFCPHCGNKASQKHIYTQEYLDTNTFLMDGERSNGPPPPCAYYIAVCETCNQVLLYHSFVDIVEDEYFQSADLIWPKEGVLHKTVPKAIAECYKEAARIINLAPNAFATQIRRALEAICDDRGVKKGVLKNRLNELAALGEIPPILAEMTEVLRLLGNIGAHATDLGVKPGHVYAIDDFFRAIIEYVYVAPSKLKEFRDRLKSFRIKLNNSNDI